LYQPLFAAALAAVLAWLNGEYGEARVQLTEAVIQVALLPQPQIEGFFPLYLGAFVSAMLAQFDVEKFKNFTEIFVRSLMKIGMMRWARVLTDHVIRCLDTFYGAEGSGVSWPELTKANAAKLGMWLDEADSASAAPVR